MTDAPSPDELSPEARDAQRELTQTAQQVARSFQRAEAVFGQSEREFAAPIAYTRARLHEIDAALAALEARGDSPDFPAAQQALTVMRRMFDASVRMMERQIVTDHRNQELASAGHAVAKEASDDAESWLIAARESALGENFRFLSVEDDLLYLLARAEVNLYLGLHHWLRSLDGIDAVLRATDEGTAITAATPEEESARARLADRFRQAMAGDEAVERELRALGPALREAWAFFEWGAQLLKKQGDWPVEARRNALADPDWQRLNGKTQLLVQLTHKMAQLPALAPFFPIPEPPVVPGEQLEWSAWPNVEAQA